MSQSRRGRVQGPNNRKKSGAVQDAQPTFRDALLILRSGLPRSRWTHFFIFANMTPPPVRSLSCCRSDG